MNKTKYLTIEKRRHLNIFCIMMLIFVGFYIFFMVLPLVIFSIYCNAYLSFLDNVDLATVSFTINLNNFIDSIFWGKFLWLSALAYGMLFASAILIFFSFFFSYDYKIKPSKCLALASFICVGISTVLLITALAFKNNAAFIYFSLMPTILIGLMSFLLFYQKEFEPFKMEANESEIDFVRREVLREYKIPNTVKKISDSFKDGE